MAQEKVDELAGRRRGETVLSSAFDGAATRLADKIGGAGGRWFDRSRRFDGGGFVIPVDPLTGSSDPAMFPYCGTPPVVGRAALDLFGDPSGTTFVDLGCGKGRMLALAAEHGFESCVGVELDAHLAAAADRNMVTARLRGGARLVDRAEVQMIDARTFAFPEAPLAIYLNNPFGVEILADVLARLEESLRARPRPVTIVLMRRSIEDPANDSPTVDLLASMPFLSGGPAAPPAGVRGALLRGYALFRFQNATS